MQELRKAIKLREDVRCFALLFGERVFECLFLINLLQEAAELKQLVRIRYCCASICGLIGCILFRSLFTLRQQQQAARESIQKAQEQKAAVSVPCFRISLAPRILFFWSFAYTLDKITWNSLRICNNCTDGEARKTNPRRTGRKGAETTGGRAAAAGRGGEGAAGAAGC
jgi:hypothetical protein